MLASWLYKALLGWALISIVTSSSARRWIGYLSSFVIYPKRHKCGYVLHDSSCCFMLSWDGRADSWDSQTFAGNNEGWKQVYLEKICIWSIADTKKHTCGSPFLTILPAEIRLHIYRRLLLSPSPIEHAGELVQSKIHFKEDTATYVNLEVSILDVCR